jgi:predicted transcriptional regulator YdeE
MIINFDGFTVIGLAACTNNAREMTAEVVIPKIWERFMKEGLAAKIPGRTDHDLLALYTDYESDEHGDYTFLVGARVSPGTPAPDGMESKQVPDARYKIVSSERGPVWRVVPEAWKQIWQEPLQRAFQADFEVYGERAANPEDAVVEIWLGVR